MKYAVVDTNVLIWWYKSGEMKGSEGREGVRPIFSVTTKIEALGFAGISKNEADAIADILNLGELVFVNDAVAQKTIELRQAYRIKTPDAIIAATAIVRGAQLWTVNTDDFEHIEGLEVYNPIGNLTHSHFS